MLCILMATQVAPAQEASQRHCQILPETKRTTPAKGIATVNVSPTVDRNESADLPEGRADNASVCLRHIRLRINAELGGNSSTNLGPGKRNVAQDCAFDDFGGMDRCRDY